MNVGAVGAGWDRRLDMGGNNLLAYEGMFPLAVPHMDSAGQRVSKELTLVLQLLFDHHSRCYCPLLPRFRVFWAPVVNSQQAHGRNSVPAH